MCYDISFSTDIQSIQFILPGVRIQQELPFEPTYDQFGMSYNRWPVILHNGGNLEVRDYIWGPVPKRLKTPQEIKEKRQFYLNNRSEKILTPASDWYKIRGKRCIIPVTGFFEYHLPAGWSEKNKVCFYISQPAQPIFAIAGLCMDCNVPGKGSDGKWDYENLVPGHTFTLSTREANPILRKIHNSGKNPFRMPLMLTWTQAQQWLDPELTDQGIAELTGFMAPSEWFGFWPVNSVRKARANDLSVIAPVEVPGLAAIA